jgi:hypothetical protein
LTAHISTHAHRRPPARRVVCASRQNQYRTNFESDLCRSASPVGVQLENGSDDVQPRLERHLIEPLAVVKVAMSKASEVQRHLFQRLGVVHAWRRPACEQREAVGRRSQAVLPDSGNQVLRVSEHDVLILIPALKLQNIQPMRWRTVIVEIAHELPPDDRLLHAENEDRQRVRWMIRNSASAERSASLFHKLRKIRAIRWEHGSRQVHTAEIGASGRSTRRVFGVRGRDTERDFHPVLGFFHHGSVSSRSDNRSHVRRTTLTYTRTGEVQRSTSTYKIKILLAEARRRLGAEVFDDGRIGRVKRGQHLSMWVGISSDEFHRAKDSGVQYAVNTFPLLQLGLSRADTQAYLDTHGFAAVSKSACVGCPYTSNAGWRNLRDNQPEQWNEAVEFDHAIRTGNARANANGRPLLGQAFLHPSLQPLAEAPIDAPPKRRHLRLVGHDETENWEDGDPDGCSPWACRSGRPEQPPGFSEVAA